MGYLTSADTNKLPGTFEARVICYLIYMVGKM